MSLRRAGRNPRGEGLFLRQWAAEEPGSPLLSSQSPRRGLLSPTDRCHVSDIDNTHTSTLMNVEQISSSQSSRRGFISPTAVDIVSRSKTRSQSPRRGLLSPTTWANGRTVHEQQGRNPHERRTKSPCRNPRGEGFFLRLVGGLEHGGELSRRNPRGEGFFLRHRGNKYELQNLYNSQSPRRGLLSPTDLRLAA